LLLCHFCFLPQRQSLARGKKAWVGKVSDATHCPVLALSGPADRRPNVRFLEKSGRHIHAHVLVYLFPSKFRMRSARGFLGGDRSCANEARETEIATLLDFAILWLI
jgi:hypothetical protein